MRIQNGLLCRPTVVGLVCLLLLALALEGLVASGLVSPAIAARPSEVLLAIGRLSEEDALGRAFLITLLQAAVATGLAMAVGLPLGYLFYRYRILGQAYRGWLAAMFSAPLVLLYPLFLVIFGRNYATVVIMGFITGLVPIVIYMYEALTKVSPTLLNVGRSFNLTPAQQFWKIQLPAAAPAAFTGIRLGLIYALVNIIGIEFLIDFGGLGRVVSDMFFRYDIPGMYAAIVFIILVSLFFLTLFSKVERWLRPA
jgi:NitT/TauT family transport system permease protein